jgi:hypothetical protein
MQFKDITKSSERNIQNTKMAPHSVPQTVSIQANLKEKNA